MIFMAFKWNLVLVDMLFQLLCLRWNLLPLLHVLAWILQKYFLNPVQNSDSLPYFSSSLSPVQPVECPECGRVFKNNKALNGHMRLHGGFDWTKKVSYIHTSACLCGDLLLKYLLFHYFVDPY